MDSEPFRPDPKTLATVLDVSINTIAANLRQCIVHGISPTVIVQMLLNQITSIVALVEPAGARQEMIKGILESVPPMVRDHVNARFMSKGGIRFPNSPE